MIWLYKRALSKESSDCLARLCCRVDGICDSLSWHGPAFSLISSVYPCAMLGIVEVEE